MKYQHLDLFFIFLATLITFSYFYDGCNQRAALQVTCRGSWPCRLGWRHVMWVCRPPNIKLIQTVEKFKNKAAVLNSSLDSCLLEDRHNKVETLIRSAASPTAAPLSDHLRKKHSRGSWWCLSLFSSWKGNGSSVCVEEPPAGNAPWPCSAEMTMAFCVENETHTHFFQLPLTFSLISGLPLIYTDSKRDASFFLLPNCSETMAAEYLHFGWSSIPNPPFKFIRINLWACMESRMVVGEKYIIPSVLQTWFYLFR